MIPSERSAVVQRGQLGDAGGTSSTSAMLVRPLIREPAGTGGEIADPVRTIVQCVRWLALNSLKRPSFAKVQLSQAHPVQQHNLPLGLAEKAENDTDKHGSLPGSHPRGPALSTT